MKGKLIIAFITLTFAFACNSSNKDKNLQDPGVIEAYEPEKPIEFPHDVHTGKNGIDCKYCHNANTDSDSVELTVNICMNCHKKIGGSDTTNR